MRRDTVQSSELSNLNTGAQNQNLPFPQPDSVWTSSTSRRYSMLNDYLVASSTMIWSSARSVHHHDYSFTGRVLNTTSIDNYHQRLPPREVWSGSNTFQNGREAEQRTLTRHPTAVNQTATGTRNSNQIGTQNPSQEMHPIHSFNVIDTSQHNNYHRRLPHREIRPDYNRTSSQTLPPRTPATSIESRNNLQSSIQNHSWEAHHTHPYPYHTSTSPPPISSRVTQMSRENRNSPALPVHMVDGVAILDTSSHQNRLMPIYDQYQNRGMLMDADNLTYEELLDLEEQIGVVQTGLSEEAILHFLQRTNHIYRPQNLTQEAEICVVCQDEYKNQEVIGRLDCGHEFHEDCIKSWLMMKNVCPICKRQGLGTRKRKRN
ncbi:E3 ubiquitin-protein ligase mbr2-like [Thalictrum thalictroides]|uniref:RING-type E3 ubiquitin transferase n=1 Tax=Thalictrum thalictroides TaxID=46969 RepID=A0A7J6VCE6_THATH|nr:E3 ubiquitin-protein ligase mbr2-like [Thalictrum thalictroides]